MVWYFLFFILIHHSIGGETSCDIQKRVVHTKLDIYFFICMVVGFISINTINAFGEAYSIQLYMIKFSVTYRRSVVFSWCYSFLLQNLALCTPHIILWFTPHGDHTRNKKLGDDFYIISTTFSFNILAFNLLEMCIIKNRNTQDLTNGDQLEHTSFWKNLFELFFSSILYYHLIIKKLKKCNFVPVPPTKWFCKNYAQGLK